MCYICCCGGCLYRFPGAVLLLCGCLLRLPSKVTSPSYSATLRDSAEDDSLWPSQDVQRWRGKAEIIFVPCLWLPFSGAVGAGQLLGRLAGACWMSYPFPSALTHLLLCFSLLESNLQSGYQVFLTPLNSSASVSPPTSSWGGPSLCGAELLESVLPSRLGQSCLCCVIASASPSLFSLASFLSSFLHVTVSGDSVTVTPKHPDRPTGLMLLYGAFFTEESSGSRCSDLQSGTERAPP